MGWHQIVIKCDRVRLGATGCDRCDWVRPVRLGATGATGCDRCDWVRPVRLGVIAESRVKGRWQAGGFPVSGSLEASFKLFMRAIITCFDGNTIVLFNECKPVEIESRLNGVSPYRAVVQFPGCPA